jgi:hypothetical protein
MSGTGSRNSKMNVNLLKLTVRNQFVMRWMKISELSTNSSVQFSEPKSSWLRGSKPVLVVMSFCALPLGQARLLSMRKHDVESKMWDSDTSVRIPCCSSDYYWSFASIPSWRFLETFSIEKALMWMSVPHPRDSHVVQSPDKTVSQAIA